MMHVIIIIKMNSIQSIRMWIDEKPISQNKTVPLWFYHRAKVFHFFCLLLSVCLCMRCEIGNVDRVGNDK